MRNLLNATILLMLTFSSCSKEDSESNYSNNNNLDPSFTLSAPSGLTATVRTDGSVYISWNYVTGATKYNVYRCNTMSGSYSFITAVTGTNATDYSPLKGYNYYKISAIQNSTESELSSYATVFIPDNSEDNNGEEEGDSENTPAQKPATPTGVTVSNEGNNYIPYIVIRWNPVDNAKKYNVFKCGTANWTLQ